MTNHVLKIVKIINVKDNWESAIRVKMAIMDLSVCVRVIAKTTNAMSAAYALSVPVVGMANSVPANVPSTVMVDATESVDFVNDVNLAGMVHSVNVKDTVLRIARTAVAQMEYVWLVLLDGTDKTVSKTVHQIV